MTNRDFRIAELTRKEINFDDPLFQTINGMGSFYREASSLSYKYNEQKKKEGKDFFESLHYYLEIIRGIHKKTKDYLNKLKASGNPITFMLGGFFYGNLKPSDDIKKNVSISTWSYGVTALSELQELHNNKTLDEDNSFAYKTLDYINNYIKAIKEKDRMLYSLYGTPRLSWVA